jgi:hypothetical protein
MLFKRVYGHTASTFSVIGMGAVSNICLLHLFRKHLTLNLSQLAGPDCRRFLLLFGPILSDLASKITKAGHSKAESDDFVQRHTAVLEPLLIVGHLTRAVRMLSADEISELKLACVRFGAAWGGWFRDLLTVKGHVVEEHVPEFVGLFGTCGILGEDGVEGLHLQDTLVRRIVRCVCNPEARHRARTRPFEAMV